MGLLLDHFLTIVNDEGREEPGFVPRQLSAAARNLLLGHSWPGNVRELSNTLRRAVLWSGSETIGPDDVREALLPSRTQQDGVLERTMGDGFVLPDVLGEVARHYLERALRESNGNKSRAARLVGLPSYQTLSNWLERYGVSGDGAARDGADPDGEPRP